MNIKKLTMDSVSAALGHAPAPTRRQEAEAQWVDFAARKGMSNDKQTVMWRLCEMTIQPEDDPQIVRDYLELSEVLETKAELRGGGGKRCRTVINRYKDQLNDVLGERGLDYIDKQPLRPLIELTVDHLGMDPVIEDNEIDEQWERYQKGRGK